MIIVNGWKLIANYYHKGLYHSILDFAAALDPPLILLLTSSLTT